MSSYSQATVAVAPFLSFGQGARVAEVGGGWRPLSKLDVLHCRTAENWRRRYFHFYGFPEYELMDRGRWE